MTTERFSLMREFKDTCSYCFAIWLAGWRILWKTFVASFLLSLFLLPIKLLGPLLDKMPYMQTATSTSDGIRGILALFLLVVYLPLIFYVAASWVGFCKRIDPAEKQKC